MVSFRDGKPDRANYRRYRMKTVVGQDDFACMAETVRRRYSRLVREAAEAAAAAVGEGGSAQMPVAEAVNANEEAGEKPGEKSAAGDEGMDPVEGQAAAETAEKTEREREVNKTQSATTATPLPQLIVIDGGKGQLNAAMEELNKLGLTQIPIIGLAKEFEEIYRPGESEPLRLSHDSGALKLLQRVRDESHRFANTYNAQLRLKKISESILDEFPGIGRNRKAALLKKFGSVQRLRLASVEEIAKVPGFGGNAAEELARFLKARTETAAGKAGLETDGQ
jgi:excinuclease ABC subunit C